MSARIDPAIVFRFQVEIDGLLVAGFSQVLGLEAETEVETYHEGGVNAYEHQLAKITKYPRLVLKRGLTDSTELWTWYQNVILGTIERKSGSIIMLNPAGEEFCRWNFFESYPVKWVGPELSASVSEVAIETLEIVHCGFELCQSG